MAIKLRWKILLFGLYMIGPLVMDLGRNAGNGTLFHIGVACAGVVFGVTLGLAKES